MDERMKNLYWHEPSVTKKGRREVNECRSCVLWFTGLSASGKSTLANAVDRKLHTMGIKSYVLDADNIRHGLNRDLGFSAKDRSENVRRIGEVAGLFVDAGLIVMTAFISPFRNDRDSARRLFKEGEFIEVFVRCSLEECERRDPKGIYRRARRGEIEEFTGLTSPYEEPVNPEIVLKTDSMNEEECISTVMDYLVRNEYIGQHLCASLDENAVDASL